MRLPIQKGMMEVNKMNNRNDTSHCYSTISLFSGICGLDLGFEGGFDYKDDHYPKLPFNVLSAYEVDAKCVETVRLNLPKIPIKEMELDIENVQGLKKAEVLIGGFPCQDFSSCGPQRGLSSSRGQLYRVMTSYMSKHRPKIVCAENVINLKRMQNGVVLETIVKDFEAEGYRVEVWNLYAPDYGIPQSRRRLFIMCIRDDLIGFPEKPLPEFADKYRTTRWAISDLENVTGNSVPNQGQYFKASKAKNGNGQGDETNPADHPSYTIRANAKSRIQFHYNLGRRLTVRECARLQTFPDTFAFPHSATASIMQIGNAVPPLLAYEIAKSLCKYLISHESAK